MKKETKTSPDYTPWAIVLVEPNSGPLTLTAWDSANADVLDRHEMRWLVGCPPLVYLPDGRRGLPVWQAGGIVSDGWDRARRLALERTEDDESEGRDLCTEMCLTVRDVMVAVTWMAKVGLCRVAVFNLVDGAVVERAL